MNWGVAGRIGPTRGKSEKLNVLGPKLKKLRQGKGLSAAELTRRLQRAGWDVSTQVYCHLEGGNRLLTDREILLIVRELGLSLSDLE